MMSDPAPTVPAMAELTDRDRALLAFERRRWIHQGAKDEAVLEEFGVSRWRYEQEVRALLDRPEALVAQPQLVNRLRRLRDARARRRAG